MDAEEARAQLALTQRKVVVSRFARSASGLYVIALGLAMSSGTLLRHYRWNMLGFFVVLFGFTVVNATARARPRNGLRWLLAALAVATVCAVVDSIWFYDKGWDSAAYRWLSACITGVPLVALGLFMVLRERSE